MPWRTVLSASQRTSFEALPSKPVDLARHYILNEEDLALIQKRRGDTNRLGFAVQLCLVRYPGRVLRAGEKIPQQLVGFIAEQTETQPEDFVGYANRDPTRREHIALLIAKLGLKTFTGTYFKEIVHWLIPVAVENPKSVFLVGAVLNELRHRHILHPTLKVTERVVAAAESRADQRVCRQVCACLNDQHRESLDNWLVPRDGQSRSLMSWIRQPVGRPCPTNVMVILEKLTAIDALELPKTALQGLSSSRLRLMVREGNRVTAQNLQTFGDLRRYAIIVATLLENRRSLVDEALAMHDRIVSRLVRRSKRRHVDQLQNNANRIRRAIGMLTILAKTLIQARDSGQDPWDAIDRIVPWDEFQILATEAEDLSHSRRLNHLYFVEVYYSQIRRYAPALLEQLNFHAAAGGQDVLEAITLLRNMNTAGKRKLPEDAPTAFITSQWVPLIQREDGLDRRYYELCALGELRNRLRSGDIWVPGSRQYQDFDGYLLGQATFNELRTEDGVPVAVETDYLTYMRQRTEFLCHRLDKVHNLIKKGKLDDFEIKENGFSIKPYRGKAVPKEAETFIQDVYAELPRIKITDLLVEVDLWTGFSDQFTHLRTGFPPEEKQGLLTVILSDGINLGLTRMAAASPGNSLRQLNWVSDWFIRDECYSRALAELINSHHRLELVTNWGDGSTSSSDGQQFSLGSVGKALGDVNAKYGKNPGIIFYTHISDQYSPFHTQLISSTIRDATYVLDGLLYHESDLKIEEHYTDTAGFTDHVFGLCHLLGFRFAPRMRDIGDLRLFPVGDMGRWPRIEPIFGERIRKEVIESQWEDILRLASSIHLGTVTASLIIRKLASYPRQNRLALAMRELGRIERTLFILDWMQDPALRSRVQAGLNKGEARNALARAVFFNRLGEVRDRSFENQCYRASGLNLVVAAIVLWNTVYLEKAVAKVRQYRDVPNDYLAYLSPLGWEHINLTGDYVWNFGSKSPTYPR